MRCECTHLPILTTTKWCWMLDLASTQRSLPGFPAFPSSWSLCSLTTRLCLVLLSCACSKVLGGVSVFQQLPMDGDLLEALVSFTYLIHIAEYCNWDPMLCMCVCEAGSSGKCSASPFHSDRKLWQSSTRTVPEYSLFSFLRGMLYITTTERFVVY